jgi:hypothetical protein
MKKFHYTYMLHAVNPVDERKFYIGARSCDVLPTEDTAYLSSSKHVEHAIQQGVVFTKTVINVFATRESALKAERALQESVEVDHNPQFFNRYIHRSVKFDPTGLTWTKEQREALGRSLSNNAQWLDAIRRSNRSEEKRAKISAVLRRHEVSVDTRKKISKTMTGVPLSPERAEKHRQNLKKLYNKKSWLEKTRKHLKKLNEAAVKNTFETAFASAQRFETHWEWREADESAYYFSVNSGRYNEITAHMKQEMRDGRKKQGYWTLCRCRASAKNFKSRKAWFLGERGAYKAANRNGWMDYCLPNQRRSKQCLA